jgi:hypothetical protein
MSQSQMSLVRIFAFVVAALLTTSASAQTFTFASINVPGGFNTEARGINSSGEIAGFYQTNTTCTETVLDIRYMSSCTKHGFTYINGTYKTVDVPGAISTVVNGLNDYGDLVGTYTTNDGGIHGFLWLHTDTIRAINPPAGHSGYAMIPMSVNKYLTVVGEWGGGSFRWVNGKSTAVAVSSDTGCPNCDGSTGIANNGTIVGFAMKGDSWRGYLKRGTDFDFFPKFLNGDSFTDAVNDKADMVGYGGGGTVAYLAKTVESNEGTTDAEKSPAYLTFAYPGSSVTLPFGVNDTRSIVGAYSDSNGIHGFLAIYH